MEVDRLYLFTAPVKAGLEIPPLSSTPAYAITADSNTYQWNGTEWVDAAGGGGGAGTTGASGATGASGPPGATGASGGGWLTAPPPAQHSSMLFTF
jgi:hypothetical protein